MKTKILWSLAVLNVALLAMFIMRQTRDNSALAQMRGAAPARAGDYVMVPGEVTGGNSEVVYVIDTTSGELVKTIPVGHEPHGLTVWPQPGRYSLGHTGNMR